jgi:copper(I)-binding protein
MKRLSLLAASLMAWSVAGAADAGGLTVSDAWSRTTPPGIQMGVVYFKIHNDTTRSDRLLKLKTPVATGAEVHRTEIVEGVARMREVAVLHLAPGERVEFAPGGLHVMLLGLRKPLVDGQTYELELLFEVAGPRKVKVTVREP